jgi:hypothetical protein
MDRHLKPAYNMVLAKAGNGYHGKQKTKLLPAFANTFTLGVIIVHEIRRKNLPRETGEIHQETAARIFPKY